MFFKDIPGQEIVKSRLIRMVNEQRIPHALLFLGNDGGGNLPMSIAFAQFILCQNKQLDESCGTCPSCLKIKNLAHPDLHLVFPFILSKDIRVSEQKMTEFRRAFLENPFMNQEFWLDELNAPNKQITIPAEQSISIIKSLNYTSFEGGYKFMIIWCPEKMNTTLANKLLKILEEPPEKTIFILVCNQYDQLLSTVISRTQLVKFAYNSDKEIKDFLIQKGVNEQRAEYASKLADGNPGNAIAIINEEPDSEEVNLLEHFQQFMRLCLKFNPFKINQWIDITSSLGREKQKQFFNYSLQLIRDCLIINHADEKITKSDPNELAFLKKFAPFIHVNNIDPIVEEFNKTIYHIERNANSKIVLMDFSLKINELINLKTK
jgi:DNA polymerase-3 subunit delta'